MWPSVNVFLYIRTEGHTNLQRLQKRCNSSHLYSGVKNSEKHSPPMLPLTKSLSRSSMISIKGWDLFPLRRRGSACCCADQARHFPSNIHTRGEAKQMLEDHPQFHLCSPAETFGAGATDKVSINDPLRWGLLNKTQAIALPLCRLSGGFWMTTRREVMKI